MDVDPAASMRCWAIDIEVGGHVFEVPPLPAADWFPVLTSGDPSLILDLLTSRSEDLDELLLSGQISGADLNEALRDAVEEATGRQFHAAFVLATVAASQWPIVNGHLAQRGFRWDVMPIGAALDAIYALVVGNMEEGPRVKFLRLLDNDALTSGKKTRNTEAVVTEFETLAGPKPTGGLTATGEQSGSARPKTRQRRQPPRPDDPLPAPTRPHARPGRSGPAASSSSP